MSSCTSGLRPLGLTFGFIQSSAVPAGLGHAPHSLDAVHQLQQEGDYLQNGFTGGIRERGFRVNSSVLKTSRSSLEAIVI